MLDKTGPVTLRVIPVRNKTISVIDGAPGRGTMVVSGLPEGNLLFLGAVAYLQFKTADADVIAAFTGSFALGSAPDANGTLAGGEVDLVPATVLAAATAKTSPYTRGVSATATCGAILDNTDGSLEVNLNLLIDDASISGAADFTVNGTVRIAVMVMGDD